MKKIIGITIVLLHAFGLLGQHLVKYDLTIKDTVINYTGKLRPAIAVNGQIPMPSLYFTEGDTAEIHVHNLMHHETSLHWHGLLLPNEQDGVSYLTTQPIKPHSTHTFRFVLRQNGTYWYHSHTMLQEQVGMYGALIVYKRGERPTNEEVLLLSDWTDEKPEQVERSLHYATDWYLLKKNAVQSYSESIKVGRLADKFENEFKRMHAMDVSDVYYNKFLINGSTSQIRQSYTKGDTIRLRVINGSSSTYFWLNYSGGKIRVVASDGMDVVPVEVDRLIVGVSEIYDVEIIIPEEDKAYEFSATSEDRIGSASMWFGHGVKIQVPAMPMLDYFAGMEMMNDMMTIGGNMKTMNMTLQQMDMNVVMYREPYDSLTTLNYNMLKSPVKTSLPEGPLRELHFELTGNMNRYVWTINNKTVSDTDLIKINKGENIRIIITNNSMMRHPMHLHGHFFRVVNQFGEYSPLKNVLDIMPMETDTIEFHAGEDYGDWYFHCHILYHMMAGMGRIFSYTNPAPQQIFDNPKAALKKVYAEDRRYYLGAEIGLESNSSDGEISFMNTHWKMSAEWRAGYNRSKGFETESHFGRYIDHNQLLLVYAGWDWRYRQSETAEQNIFGLTSTKNDRGVLHAGIQYTLPWFIVANASIDHTGYFRLQFKREDIALTKRIRLWGMWNSDREYAIGARYIMTKYLSASSHYDSDMGFGAGLTFTY